LYKQVLSSIEGIQIYPLFSLIVFFCFFMALSLWCVLTDPEKMKKNAAIPLNEGVDSHEEYI